MSIPPTLLLADDSLTIQRVVSLTFADQAVRVVVAKDGQDAINRMTNDRPDLVLADTNMPCVDGYELARWVRQQPHLSAVPVLLLAGVTDPVDEQRLHDSGANGVLEKPFEPSHVISRVKELLGLKAAPPPSAGRLVTSADAKPSAKPPAGKPPAPGSERPFAASAPNRAGEPPRPAPVDSRYDDAFGPPGTPTSPGSPFREGGFTADQADALSGPRGDARDWFGDEVREATTGASLAEELGVSDRHFYERAPDVPVSRVERDLPSERAERQSSSVRAPAPATPADAFESLLAAEQGDSPAPVFRAAIPELTPEALDQLADRIVERLHPKALSDELQRGLGTGLREAAAHMLRESVAPDTRAAVAEAVQSAVNGTILGTIRGAVNEAVAAAVPSALEQMSTRIERAVRDVVAHEVREIVHDTAERLVREEIARIRAGRAS